MAKPKFPSKTCPKCGKLIHARSKQHEACGWVMAANGPAAPAAKVTTRQKLGRPRKVHAGSVAGKITLEDIQAVKVLADRIGAEKVRQLAAVFAK